MERLNYDVLAKSGYDGYLLKDAPEKVLQFGDGNFLRAFTDYFFDVANEKLTRATLAHLQENELDFTFLYFGYPDAAGHNHGWMSAEYMESMEQSWNCIQTVIETLGTEEYNFIITADHGGHDRTHGTQLPEDMIIPIICYGKSFEAGKVLTDANIMDIAPTITALQGVAPVAEWEGKSLLG